MYGGWAMPAWISVASLPCQRDETLMTGFRRRATMTRVQRAGSSIVEHAAVE
jgi:hypothetical protein